MKKARFVLVLAVGILVGIASVALAQTFVQCKVSFESSENIPALGNVTQWTYTWHTVADSRGIAYGDCDATCRRQIVGEKMREQFNAWLYQQIANKNNSTANATTAAQVQALQGVVE